jgi:predicted amidophosphoribosyltransferase
MIREVIRQTYGLLVPLECTCGRPGALLCPDCARLLDASPRRVDQGCDALQVLTDAHVRETGELPAGVELSPVIPVYALGEYAGALKQLVLAFKDGGRFVLAPRIARGMGPALGALDPSADPSSPEAVQSDNGQRGPLLVPVPSRTRARIRRGEDHTALLASALARTTGGRSVTVRARMGGGQKGRGARERRTRSIGLHVPSALRGPGRGPVVLVDDVVTTGATLRGMVEALDAQGIRTAGAVVIAASRIPGRTGTDAPAAPRTRTPGDRSARTAMSGPVTGIA